MAYRTWKEQRALYRRRREREAFRAAAHKAQRGLCKLCHRTITLGNVDHCHKTGIIRGLICGKCNQELRRLRDNVEPAERYIEHLKSEIVRMRRIIKYLKRIQ